MVSLRRHLRLAIQPQWECVQGCWDTSLTNDWCHFQLEKPRKGIEGLKRDLGMLPESVIALLGRQSLRSISRGGADMLITSLGLPGPAAHSARAGGRAILVGGVAMVLWRLFCEPR